MICQLKLVPGTATSDQSTEVGAGPTLSTEVGVGTALYTGVGSSITLSTDVSNSTTLNDICLAIGPTCNASIEKHTKKTPNDISSGRGSGGGCYGSNVN